MVITYETKEELQLINATIDAALKYAGVQALNPAVSLLQNLKMKEEVVKDENKKN